MRNQSAPALAPEFNWRAWASQFMRAALGDGSGLGLWAERLVRALTVATHRGCIRWDAKQCSRYRCNWTSGRETFAVALARCGSGELALRVTYAAYRKHPAACTRFFGGNRGSGCPLGRLRGAIESVRATAKDR